MSSYIYENFPKVEDIASLSRDGLMSKEDKAKLDGIEEGANNYVHPDDENTRHVTDAQIAKWDAGAASYTSEDPTVVDFGGIPAGTTFEDKPLVEVLDQLLHPYVAPIVAATSTPNGGIYEIGDSVGVSTITVNVTKKSENITKVEVFDGSVSLGSKTEGILTGTLDFPQTDLNVTTNKTFQVKVTDEKKTTTVNTTSAFTFVYPYYVGVCDSDATIDEALVKSLTKKIESKTAVKSVDYTTNNQKMVFAYPKAYGALKKIVDANKFDVTSTFTAVEVAIVGLNNVAQTYYVYVSKNSSTVTAFNMQFNY